MSSSMGPYASYRQCTLCGNGPSPDIWVDAFEGSPTFGQCASCRNPAALAVRPPELLAVDRSLAQMQAFTIATPAQKAQFAAALEYARAEWKRYDVLEKESTKPKLAEVEASREKYRPFKVAFKLLGDTIARKLHDHEVSTALEVEEATTKARELAAAGASDGAREALAAAGAIPEDAPGMQTRHPWTFEVLDLYMLKSEYLLPNLKAITEEMRRQLKENPEETPVMSGVKFYRGLEVAAAPTRKRRAK